VPADARTEPVTAQEFIANYAPVATGTRPKPASNFWQKWYGVAMLLIGMAFGLFVLGWWVWPVEWINADLVHLRHLEQQQVVILAGDLLAYDLDSERVQELFDGWPDAWQEACYLATITHDQSAQVRLVTLAYVLHDEGCK